MGVDPTDVVPVGVLAFSEAGGGREGGRRGEGEREGERGKGRVLAYPYNVLVTFYTV